MANITNFYTGVMRKVVGTVIIPLTLAIALKLNWTFPSMCTF